MAQRPRHACAHNAVIEKAGAGAALPDEIRAAFDGGLARMSTLMHMLGVRKERRRAIGKRRNPSPSP